MVLVTYTIEHTEGRHRFVAEERGEKIPERLLAKLWRERAARQSSLRTQAGKRVRVVYPGRPGTAAGPDFRDAIVEVEGLGTVRGDVELHLRQRDWDAHGRGGDPNYNGVVIHGALEVESEQTRLYSGVQAPLVDLGALLNEPGPAEDGVFDFWHLLAGKGFARPESEAEATEVLERAGDARFMAKARWLGQSINDLGPDQALYQALMEGLGYSTNRRPFLELASRAPYGVLDAEAKQAAPDGRRRKIYGWLAACSGLTEAYTTRPRGMDPAMDRKEWRLFRVRPSNHPLRRIMGAAQITERYLESGLASGLVELAAGGNAAKLTKRLVVVGSDGPAPVGTGRARDLAVNAVLPFVHALGRWEGPRWSNALDLYRGFPKLADNELTREMKAQLLPAHWHGTVSNARRQQGLLHLSALLKGAF